MRKTPVPRNRRLGLVCALHALRGQLRVGAMATVYRALARRSFAASLTIAREDQVARPIPAQKECRCGEWVLGPRASGWLAQSCGKHLGHRTARCSLRGNGSSCSARAHNLVGFHTEIGLGADQTEGDLDLARLVAELKKHLLISPRPVERLLGTAVRAYVTSTYVCRRPRRPSKFSR